MGFKIDSLKKVYFIGIKGTGMCALAELMHRAGVLVSGSDREEVFYTDAILREEGIPYYESFDPSHIEKDPPPDLVIYSAAYSFDTNPEMIEARRRGLKILKYTDALGAYSALFDSSGIAGVHGKTTTTAMAGAMMRGAGLPARILAGSAVGAFGGRSTLSLGEKYFVAETCEYRRHFLAFHPRRIVLTSVEWDHQDYFPSRESIGDAFLDYCRLLPPGGELIYCADDPGAAEVAATLKEEGRDLCFIPYGFGAEGEWRIESCEVKDERLVMGIQGFPGPLRLRIPGRHSCLNAAAALALTSSLVREEFGGGRNGGWNGPRREEVRRALEKFTGSRRRTEVLGEAGGILFMDDYAHHPTAIKTTLAGLKEFYPRRRLVVSFMSHTYSRTASLLNEFAASFDQADFLVLHKIYPSAREEYHGGVTGLSLFEKTRDRFLQTGDKKHREGRKVVYAAEPGDASPGLTETLRKGDLFITLGAGDNWKLGRKLFSFYEEKEKGRQAV